MEDDHLRICLKQVERAHTPTESPLSPALLFAWVLEIPRL